MKITGAVQPVTYRNLEYKDILMLTPIMKAAFDADTRMHTDLYEDGPWGYDTGELLEKLLKEENTVSRVILCGGQIIGEYTITKGRDYFTLDLLFLNPQYESKGIGAIVWRDIERAYPEAAGWYVETPAYSTRNHHFYKKCGFVLMKENICEDGEKSFVFVKRR